MPILSAHGRWGIDGVALAKRSGCWCDSASMVAWSTASFRSLLIREGRAVCLSVEAWENGRRY